MTDSPRYNSILQVIDDHLIPDETAKKERGEVFTPPDLVREMLFGLRKDKLQAGISEIWGLDESGNFMDDDEDNRVGGLPTHIWRNPEIKWLDPANGIGNFPVIAFYKLDYELSKVAGFHDKNKRRKHIIQNMLFMIEIDKGNCVTCRQIFRKIYADAAPNVLCADTLSMTDEDLLKEFGLNRFDVIMGNPPFNTGGTKHHSDRGFYSKFIIYGISKLLQNGYLIYIHPPNYHRLNKNSVREVFNENNLIFLNIISNTKDYFDVQISLDYYVLQKKANSKNTTIYDKNNALNEHINIAEFNYIPNYGYGAIKKLIKFKNEYGSFKSQYGRDSNKHLSRTEYYSNKGKYKIIHTIVQDGMRVYLSNAKHTYHDIRKVIINGLGETYIFYDSNGTYGVTQIPMFVLEPSKKELIFLNSSLFQYLLWAYKIQGNNNDMFVFEVLPDFNSMKYTNEHELFEELNLSEDLFMDYQPPTFIKEDKIQKYTKKQNKTRRLNNSNRKFTRKNNK